MKILRIIARLNVGGPARHVVWLADGLEREGFETRLIAGRVPEGEEDMAYFAAEHGVEPVFIEQMSRELSLNDVVSIWKVYGEMRSFQPDVVHTHTAKAGTVGRVAAFCYRWLTPGTLIGRPRRVRVVHTFHGHVFHSYYGKLKTSVFVAIEKVLAAVATHRIVVITGQQLREINQDFGVGSAGQFSVIPLGLDLAPLQADGDKRAEFRNDLGIADDIFLAAFVGRLTEIKNIPMILRAAAHERIKIESREMRFVIVGDGNLRSDLEAKAVSMGVADRVMFAGNRTDIAAVYAGSDAVILTSLNEGTPLSLIEAMASGKPVISTAVGGVTDLLGEVTQDDDGVQIRERGITVPSGDSARLARAIALITEDAGLRTKMADAGKNFVTEKYSKERLLSDIKELYSDLVRS
jgi:glycosyltransferase involved in cell wall biosynthesis